MRLRLSVLVGFCLFTTTGITWAQTASVPLVTSQATSTKDISANNLNSPGESIGRLTLAEALNLVLKNNSSLAAFAEEIHAKDAAAQQAGLLPNPNLAVELENFAGEDELEGFDSAETTIALSQLVELGGKRSKRRQVATLEKDLAGWDYQTKNFDVLASTAKTFIQVLAAQQRQTLTEELVRLSEQTFAAVAARVEAGKVPPLEQTRAQVELASARTVAYKARRELQANRGRLAAFWGVLQPEFSQAVGDLTTINPVPNEEDFYSLLKNNPDLARWDTEIDQSEATVNLASAKAIPDLTFSFGVRNFQESGSNALVAGFELPLPLFDRNQGGVREARATLEKARHERRAAEIEARADLAEAYQSLSASYAEAITLRDEILPSAQSAFEASDFAYREGKFGFLQMIDAQRTLFVFKGQYLQALATYHQSRIEVERLTGSPLMGLLKSANKLNQELR